MKAIDQLKGMLIKKPGIDLPANNGCLFRTSGSLGIPKQVTTQTTKNKPGIGVGVSVPVAGPFRIGIGKKLFGGSKTTTKTQTVYDHKACTFYMTFYNFILKTGEGNITVDFEDLKGIKMHKDGMILQCGPIEHIIFMKNADVQKFMSTFALIGQAGREGAKLEDLL